MPYLQRTFVREDKVSLLAFVVRPPAVAGNQIFFFPFSSLSRQDRYKHFFSSILIPSSNFIPLLILLSQHSRNC